MSDSVVRACENCDLVHPETRKLAPMPSRKAAATTVADDLLSAAKNLRQAQRAYMGDRGNEELGKAVGAAAVVLDEAIAKAESTHVRAAAEKHGFDLYTVTSAYMRYLERSVNVGPLTNNPTKEAALLTAIRSLLSRIEESQ